MFSTKNIPDERLKVWLDFWKFIVVSGAVAVVITLVPALINAQIQKNTLALKEAEQKAQIQLAIVNQERQYVQEFLTYATDLNVEKRFMFTQYASALARDETLRIGWTKLFEAAQLEKTKTEQALAKASEQLLNASGEALKTAQTAVARLTSELSRQPTRAQIRSTAVRISEVNSKYPCPSETDLHLGAYVGADRKDSAGVPINPEKFLFPSTTDRAVNLARLCIDKNGKVADIKIVLPIEYTPEFNTAFSAMHLR